MLTRASLGMRTSQEHIKRKMFLIITLMLFFCVYPRISKAEKYFRFISSNASIVYTVDITQVPEFLRNTDNGYDVVDVVGLGGIKFLTMVPYPFPNDWRKQPLEFRCSDWKGLADLECMSINIVD